MIDSGTDFTDGIIIFIIIANIRVEIKKFR